MTLDITTLKSEAYLGIADSSFDEPLQIFLDGIISCAIDYIDNELIISIDELPEKLHHRILQQTAYEFNRRKDLGLLSVTYPNGTVNKFTIEEWLPNVKEALDRNRVITL